MSSVEDVVLVAGTADDIPRLQPLWVSVHHQHQSAMPELAPYVTDETTWAERSALYETLLAKRDTILWIAQLDDRAVGYGLAHVMPVSDTWIADTWVTGDRVGEIESLAVDPEFRGQGIGSRLLKQLIKDLNEQGVSDHVIGALPGNVDAIRLYERHGYQRAWTYLMNRPN
jgi:ribosomal protein S18 acetylase RimI-like enzyme